MDGPKHKPADTTGHGYCERCGYDLAGNESGHCPECGASGPGVVRMPPDWRILVVALAVPLGTMVVWIIWSFLASAG